ncbi:MAG: dinitrogenase iron-molybdenum cofactor biosynthesis protein [Desulfurococcaceae archaeon]
MRYVLITCSGENVVDFNSAKDIVLYDVVENKIVKRIEKPENLDYLEELIEQYDPWLLFTLSIDPELYGYIEETGIKIIIVADKKTVEELIKDYF